MAQGKPEPGELLGQSSQAGMRDAQVETFSFDKTPNTTNLGVFNPGHLSRGWGILLVAK